MRASAFLIMVRLSNPRKSNFTAPWCSAPFIEYMDCMPSPLAGEHTGSTSWMSVFMMIKPAACVERLELSPSSALPQRINAFSFSSPSRSRRASSGSRSMASCSVMPSLLGISLAILSAWLYGKSSTRATLRRAALAPNEPNVEIWQTFSAPYLPRT